MKIRNFDLRKLNSLTKYPSIPTYHSLDPRNGNLLPEHVTFEDQVDVTEKVDGANTRIIFLEDGYIIGSREELLTARGDFVHNPMLGIVDTARDAAERCYKEAPAADGLVVFYFESYGGRGMGHAHQYSGSRKPAMVLLDIAAFAAAEIEEMLTWAPDRLAAWRDRGEQHFEHTNLLEMWARTMGVRTAPRLFSLPAAELPIGVEETLSWLTQHLPTTRCAIDDGAGQRPEGVVLRSTSRRRLTPQRIIAKARFEDYERTLRPATPRPSRKK